MSPLSNVTKPVLCKRGPFFLLRPRKCPWPCVEPKWILVTVSLLQSSSGDHDHILSVVTGGGDCLYSWPVSSITLEKCSYKYRGSYCRRKEKIALRIRKEEEQIMLWAEDEDEEGWMELITNCQVMTGQPTIMDIGVSGVGNGRCKTRLGQFYEDSSGCSKQCYPSRDISDAIKTNDDDAPDWFLKLQGVDRKESDMITFDYDQMYKELKPLTANQDRGTFQVVTSVVRQLITTMNPSKVRLPACVLECRSLLESYADAFSRPELFSSISCGTSPDNRLLRVAAFFLSQLKCMRPIKCISKPYNPVFGEYFVCSWPEPQYGDVYFVAEQTSHHPPVSSFHAVCPKTNVSLTSTVFTKLGFITSKMPPFLKAMTVDCEGQATISLGNHEEVYTMTYPTAVATGFLSYSPSLLLSGKVSISCSSNLGRIDLTFVDESLVHGDVYDTESGVQVATIGGDWRKLVEICYEDGGKEKIEFKDEDGILKDEKCKREDGRKAVLLDMSNWTEPSDQKRVPDIASQGELESRRLWRFLSRSLAGHMPEMDADTAKTSVEEWARRRRTEECSLQFFQVDPENHLSVEFMFRPEEERKVVDS